MTARRKKKKKRRKHRTSRRTPPPSRCTALMVVDSSRIRRRAMGNCKRARTTFEKAERELVAYESRDKPAFVRWYRAAFGPLIGEAKSLADQIADIHLKMERLGRFTELAGCSRQQAAQCLEDSPEEFERLERECLERLQRDAERQRREFEEAQEEDEREVRSVFAEFLESNADVIPHLCETETPSDVVMCLVAEFCRQYECFAPFVMMALDHPEGVALLDRYGLNDHFGRADNDPFDEDFGEDFEEDDNLFDKMFGFYERAADGEPDRARLSFLRRQLAFALHPDQSDSASDPAKMELWYQVQEAVENRDLDRLEVLYAHCRMLSGDLSAQTPVSHVRALTDMYRQSRDALRRRIRALRKNPEWGFFDLGEKDRETMQRKLERQLNEQIEHLRYELKETQEIYRFRFTRPPSRTARSAPPASERPEDAFQDRFEFF